MKSLRKFIVALSLLTTGLLSGSALLAETISGRVIEMQGSCMPPGPCRSFPVKTQVLVIEGQVSNPDLNTSIPLENVLSLPSLRHVVETDDNGHYEVNVQPNMVYTVMAVFDDQAYLNAINRQYFATVSVEPGQSVTFDIVNTDRAIF